MESSTLPPGLDLWTQDFTFYNPDGTIATGSFQELNRLRLYGSRSAINYGSQIGASMMLLLILLLLTKSSKRRSFIFLINAVCLLANTIRCILLCSYFTSSLWNPYSQMTGDWSGVETSDLATVVTAVIFTLSITLMVYVSLSLQVWVVCVTTRPLQRCIIMGATSAMACTAFGMKATVAIYNIQALLTFQSMVPHENLISISYVMQAVAIWIFSCIFTYKLGYAIIERRRLNMPQFGPIQVVFIMGCQTMSIPGMDFKASVTQSPTKLCLAIFSSLQFSSSVPEFGTQVLTVVCIFLPLSAIWAGVLNDTGIARKGSNSHQHLIHNEFYGSATSSNGTSTTAYDKRRQMSICTFTKGKDIESAITTPRSRMDDIKEADAIHVDSEFGFSRDEAANQA